MTGTAPRASGLGTAGLGLGFGVDGATAGFGTGLVGRGGTRALPRPRRLTRVLKEGNHQLPLPRFQQLFNELQNGGIGLPVRGREEERE